MEDGCRLQVKKDACHRRTQGNFLYSRFLDYLIRFRSSFTKLDQDGSCYIEWNGIHQEPALILRLLQEQASSLRPVAPRHQPTAECSCNVLQTLTHDLVNEPPPGHIQPHLDLCVSLTAS
ncbi:unnamed protein product [Pleuronectes platessa]|uniref:Uncharacterized protein n=1 Tax=Pleuronectes platessa TaxID=8262 RepID=A0A9N7UPH6_PLEPL|nr:unnamed protein product [Pleuronectes platessa]